LNGSAIGAVTSAVLPPGRRHAIALAYVKSRELPDATTAVGVEDGGTVRSATLIRS
jgi:glycine cleavage system aminomethyltransferase T